MCIQLYCFIIIIIIILFGNYVYCYCSSLSYPVTVTCRVCLFVSLPIVYTFYLLTCECCLLRLFFSLLLLFFFLSLLTLSPLLSLLSFSSIRQQVCFFWLFPDTWLVSPLFTILSDGACTVLSSLLPSTDVHCDARR